MDKLTGRCMCGGIHFEISAPPDFSFICACTQCQKTTGTGHAPAFAVPAGAVTIRGQLKFYEQKADSGNTVSNGFCPECGNPIVKKTSGHPERLYFHVAALDNPDAFRPEKVIFRGSVRGWDRVGL
ncbi:MAG: GFA family protein [Gammaproteobacteria bacterium]|nr:GFA family protein [Gammaproteobacteria bacterium]